MRKPVILSAEDNPVNRRIIRDLLGSRGYEVLEAANGRDAIAMAQRHLPDLILMDIQLPGISGYEAARAIKARPELRHIPIVAVTSYALSGDDQRALDAGCEHYISKPFHPRDLLDLVERRLAARADAADA